MTYSELTRRVRRLGYALLRQGKRHEIWGRPGSDLSTSIPRHQASEIPIGTLHRILKDLDLRLEDL